MRGLICAISSTALLAASVAAQTQLPQPARHPDVIFVPSADDVVDAMLKLAKVTAKDVVYDLGCGDGKIVIAAARQYGARGVGIDIDPELVDKATQSARRAGLSDKVTFKVGDIFSDDVKIGDATVVALYLLPSLNERLRPKLWRELRLGTRVVSNSFAMGDAWPAEKRQQVGDTWVYFWTIPKRQASPPSFMLRSR